MQQPEKLPLSKQLTYASGMLGWSVMFAIVAVMQPYFFIPPENSGLTSLLPSGSYFIIFSALAIIILSGRVWDAITDPLVAYLSDKSKNPKGRRIPFMKYSLAPLLVFSVLMFMPIHQYESSQNAWWLALIQFFFYVSLTVYIIPYNALLPEFSHSTDEKQRLVTMQALAFMVGLMVGSSAPVLADLIQNTFGVAERFRAVQYAIWAMFTVGVFFMAVPVFSINEKKYCIGKPLVTPLIPALKHALEKRNFRYFIVADCTYYTAIAIIVGSLLYYVKVLLLLEESVGTGLVVAMVLCSIASFPLVSWLSGKVKKKTLIIISFFIMGALFANTYFLGKYPVSNLFQGYFIVVLFAFPIVVLNILPPTILAEIADQDSRKSGQNKEGLFYAVRNIFVKLGQTIGYVVFPMLAIYGKDPGNDMGIRLTGVIGCILCVAAGLIFFGFDEDKLNRESGANEGTSQ